MDAVKQISLEPGVTPVTFAENQPQYAPLPALVYPDGSVLVEWHFTDEERERIARGEDLRHWIWKGVAHRCSNCGLVTPCLLQPTMLEVTDERIT
jgi:hypothetical protein